MAEMKLDITKTVKVTAEKALDEFHYRGLTIREWADKITSGEYQPVKHGRWIRTSKPCASSPVQHCSECGMNTNYDLPYCPNCGAKMDGGDTT